MVECFIVKANETEEQLDGAQLTRFS